MSSKTTHQNEEFTFEFEPTEKKWLVTDEEEGDDQAATEWTNKEVYHPAKPVTYTYQKNKAL